MSECKGHSVLLCVLYVQEVSPFERQIQRDLARTFPEHAFFKERDGLGQEALLNILKVSEEGGKRRVCADNS